MIRRVFLSLLLLPLLLLAGAALWLLSSLPVTKGRVSLQGLSARVAIVEGKGQANDPRPWFEFKWSLAVGDKEMSQREFDELVDAKATLVFIDRRPVL